MKKYCPKCDKKTVARRKAPWWMGYRGLIGIGLYVLATGPTLCGECGEPYPPEGGSRMTPTHSFTSTPPRPRAGR